MAILACSGLLLLIVLGSDAQDYCRICKDHTMCLYTRPDSACARRKFSGVSETTRTQIVEIHNRYRRIVANGQERRGDPGPQPHAANMNMVTWDEELQKVAQTWANQCKFQHDKCRNVGRFGWVGQNLYQSGLWSSAGVTADNIQDWETAVAAFYNEVKDFNYKNVYKFNSYESKNQTGHYSQLVWGETLLIGCGFTSYMEWKNGKDWYNKYYVCNYAPGGNVIGEKVYEDGNACSKCPPDSKCQDGLCVVKPSSQNRPRPVRSNIFTIEDLLRVLRG